MRSAIISVGTELLFGKVVNTNASFLSQELNELGIDVMYHYTLGDNPVRLKRILALALEDCDLLLITGGLGPTEDDLTKEIVCEYMGRELVLDMDMAEKMKGYFEKTGYIYTENNMKQAYLPVDSTIFPNTQGTAPGFAVENDGKCIICMPGVPREMKAMYFEAARPFLMKKADACIFSRSVKVFGVGESLTETMLLPFIDGQTDPTIATYAKEGIVEIRITSKKKTGEEAAAAVDRMLGGVMETMGDSVFTTEGRELQEEAVLRLLEKDITIASCECPTSGLFASWLTQMPEITPLFGGGYVVYDEKSMAAVMGIDEAFIKEHTIYGNEASEAMAEKLYEKTGCRLCISIAGNAGPDEAEGCRPGSYSISILLDGKMHTRSYEHKGRSRAMNREFMTQSMYDMMIRLLDGKRMTEVR